MNVKSIKSLEKKFLNLLLKGERIEIQEAEDYVYITNLFAIYKIPKRFNFLKDNRENRLDSKKLFNSSDESVEYFLTGRMIEKEKDLLYEFRNADNEHLYINITFLTYINCNKDIRFFGKNSISPLSVYEKGEKIVLILPVRYKEGDLND